MKEFISLTMVAMEIRNRLFFHYDSNGEKKPYKNLNLKDINCDWKNLVAWIRARWDEKSQPQKCTFLEKGCES